MPRTLPSSTLPSLEGAMDGRFALKCTALSFPEKGRVEAQKGISNSLKPPPAAPDCPFRMCTDYGPAG